MQRDEIFIFLVAWRQRPRTLKVWLRSAFLLAITPLYWAAMLSLALVMAPSFAVSAVAAWLARLHHRSWYAKHFGDQPVEEVVAASPYELAHFQGEDGYRIYDKRLPVDKDPIGFVGTISGGHAAICRLIIAERLGDG
jgi:hypothetical protein